MGRPDPVIKKARADATTAAAGEEEEEEKKDDEAIHTNDGYDCAMDGPLPCCVSRVYPPCPNG